MISGEMRGPAGMLMNGGAGSGMSSNGPMGSGMRGAPNNPATSGDFGHVDVHICGRASGRVVQNAGPANSLTDTSGSGMTGSGMTQKLPLAVTQGVHSEIGDLQYGDNARMILGHHSTLHVVMHGEHAAFNLGAAR